MANTEGSLLPVVTPVASGRTIGVREPFLESNSSVGYANTDLNPNIAITTAETAEGVTSVDIDFKVGEVLRYGPNSNPGTTDMTAIVQTAIDVVGVSGEVIFPNEVVLCDGALTGKDFQTWRGPAYELGVGAARAVLKSSLTSGVFITLGANQRFESLYFQGVMTFNDSTHAVAASTAICMRTDGNVTLHDVIFQKQFVCIQTVNAFYIRIYGGETVRCASFIDMITDDVFNLEFEGFITRLTNTVISSNTSKFVNNLKVIGGSFEGWTNAFNNIASASFFGTYFETDFEGAFGFNSAGNFTVDVSLSFFGCEVFLNNCDRFINYSGLAGGTLISIGNTIAAGVTSAENLFYFVPQDAGTGRTVMLGDFEDDRGSGTYFGTYVSTNSKLNGQLIVWPRGGAADHANVGQTWIDGIVLGKDPVVLANDATPSVAGGQLFKTGGTTSITDFDDGVLGQTIKIKAEHSVTITDGTPIQLNGSVNFDMVSGDTLTFYMFTDQVWEETARSTTTITSEVVTTTNVITASENGKTFYLDTAGGFTSTLPAPAIGLKYKFIVSTAPTTAYIITTNSGDNVLFGTFLDIVGELVYFSAQDTLNFVASTSPIGDFLEVESDGTNWYCVAKSGVNGGITVAVT